MRSVIATEFSSNTQIIKIISRISECLAFSGGVVVDCEAPTFGWSIARHCGGNYERVVPEVSWVILYQLSVLHVEFYT